MRYNSKMLGAVGLAALSVLAANPAQATGTTAGTSVVNTATVNFTVGGVAQTAQTASNTFVVDNKIVLTDTFQPSAAVAVSPGQTGAVLTYLVTNSSNTAIDVGLSAGAQNAGALVFGGTNNVTATGLTYQTNAPTAGVCNYASPAPTTVTYLGSLAANGTACVYVLATIPATATNGQNGGVDLQVQADVAGSGGATALTASTGAWTPGTVQTVLADAAGNGSGDASGVTDTTYDGKYTALGQYVISAPVLTINKNSQVISDPVDGTTNPKAIPGATLQYCIIVANASGAGASATGISISDVLPSYVSYVTSSIMLGATVTGTGSTATCSGGTAGGTYTSATTTVSGTDSAALAAGGTWAMLFQVTIN